MAKSGASLFKSSEGEEKFKAAYNRALESWGVAHECLEVPTRFGATHLISSGVGSAPPLILLHGMGVCSTFWYPNIAELGRDFRTFAVDVIGGAGRSLTTTPPKNRAEYAEWLMDVFDALNVGQAHVAGLSYGAFLALNFALCVPDRVQRLVLLAPAGCFAPLRVEFWLRSLSMLVPTRPIVNSFVRWISVKDDICDDVVIDQMYLGLRHCRVQMKVPPGLFTDEELAKVKNATLLLIGEREVLCDPRAAIERARRCMPHIEAEIIPNAGHALSFDQPELVDARVLTFLNHE